MSKSKTTFTAGPWVSSFAAGSNGPALFAQVAGKNVRIANFVEATEDDRSLIASAPTLLEASRSVDTFGRSNPWTGLSDAENNWVLETVRAAIALAEGGERG